MDKVKLIVINTGIVMPYCIIDRNQAGNPTVKFEPVGEVSKATADILLKEQSTNFAEYDPHNKDHQALSKEDAWKWAEDYGEPEIAKLVDGMTKPEKDIMEIFGKKIIENRGKADLAMLKASISDDFDLPETDAELTKNLEAAKKSIGDMQASSQQKDDKILSLGNEVSQLKTANGNLTVEKEQLGKEVTGLKADLDKANKEIEKLKKK
jgi:hypothetical protein